jgi:flagellar biosynthetic protein FliR/FlhB
LIDTTYYLTIFFIFVRLISFLGIISVFFPSSAPKSFKVFTTLIFAYIVANIVDHTTVDSIASNYTIVMYILNEFMTGLILGFITNLCFYIFEFAGSLMDMQIGLSMLTMYDPNSKNTTTLLSRVVHWMGILIFFIVDGHHILIKELLASYNVVPIGKTIVYSDSIKTVLTAFSQYFIIGLKIALPIVLIIIITDLALGLVSRTVPQLNIMILGDRKSVV